MTPRWPESITCCPKGHPYVEANVMLRRDRHGVPKYRKCRTCARERSAAARLTRPAPVPPPPRPPRVAEPPPTRSEPRKRERRLTVPNRKVLSDDLSAVARLVARHARDRADEALLLDALGVS